MRELRWYEPAINKDARGAHVKYFGKNPEKVAVEGFQVAEVFETRSNKNVIRGIHFQTDPWQPKLVVVTRGAVNLNCFKLPSTVEELEPVQHVMVGAGADTMLEVPAGYGLGYCSLVDDTRVLYLAGSDFNPASDGGIDPFDPDLDLYWGVDRDEAILSEKDRNLPSLREFLKSSERS